MDSKLVNNQIITGNYTYDGCDYNAIIECDTIMFENYVDALSMANNGEGINKREREHCVTVFLNEAVACGYDKDNNILYVNVPEWSADIDQYDAETLRQISEAYSQDEINDAMNDIIEENEVTVSDKEIVLDFISFLEGYALRFKEFHWDSEKASKHATAEKAYDLVYNLEDSLAEDMMGFTDSRIKPGSVNPVMPAERLNPPQDDIEVDLVTTLNMLRDDTFSFYRKVEHNNNFIGIRSEVENFLHELTQLIYLARMA